MGAQLTETEQIVIIWTFYICSVFNLLGALFTMIIYYVFRDGRNESTQLIFFLALSDFTSAFAGTVLGVARVHFPNEPLCIIQGAALMLGGTASMMWGLSVGVYMYLVLYKDIDIEKLHKYQFIFHIFAWGFPLFATILPMISHQYSEIFPNLSITWCWIGDPRSPYRLLSYGPDTAAYVALGIFYILVRRKLRNVRNAVANSVVRKMSLYLLAYIFINTFCIINRISNYIFPHTEVFALFELQFLTQPTQGLINAFVYVWNEPVYIDQFKHLYAKITIKQHIPVVNDEENERLISAMSYDYGKAGSQEYRIN